MEIFRQFSCEDIPHEDQYKLKFTKMYIYIMGSCGRMERKKKNLSLFTKIDPSLSIQIDCNLTKNKNVGCVPIAP